MSTSRLASEKHIDYHNDLFHAHMLSAHVLLKRILECVSCGQCFQNKRDYMLHKVEHIQSSVKNARNPNQNRLIAKPHKCPECGLKFAAESTLEAHAAVHQPLPHVCECGIGYYTLKDLNSHRNIVHIYKANVSKEQKKLPWKPKIEIFTVKENIPNFAPIPNLKGPRMRAELLFKSVPTIRKTIKRGQSKTENQTSEIRINKNIHIKKTSDKKFVCPTCGKALHSKASVFTHLRTHTGEKPYKCTQCSKAFNQPGALKIHLMRHIGKKDFACKYCAKRFYDGGALQLHTRTHTGEKPYNCSFCKKAFSDKSAHSRHERTHTGDKPYKCPYCPKTFSDASGLIMHKYRHENVKKFPCETCGKKFYDRCSVRKHLKVHELDENKPYSCDHCKTFFQNKKNLEKHIRIIHLDTKKYKCEYCSKCFYHKISMVKHAETWHKHTKDYKSEL